MLFKKKTPTTVGRQRPATTAQRHNSAVFSYHAARLGRPDGENIGRRNAEQQSATSAAAARRSGRWQFAKRLPTVLALPLLVGLLLDSLYVGGTPRFVLQSSETHALLRDQSVYIQAAEDLLAGSLTNHAKLTINTSRIASQLQDHFPELGQVTVTLPVLGHTPTVVAQGATPAIILSTTSGEAYILDTTGRALALATQVPGPAKLHLPVVADQSGLAVTAGKVTLPGATTNFIKEVAGQLQASHLKITSLTLPAGANELDVRVDGVGYFVKFNVRGDGRAEAGSFLAAKSQLDRTHTAAKTYIDVRVDGRAYYK